jgi:hypothetical protein
MFTDKFKIYYSFNQFIPALAQLRGVFINSMELGIDEKLFILFNNRRKWGRVVRGSFCDYLGRMRPTIWWKFHHSMML